MDSTHLAVAGIAFFVIGAVGFVLVTLFFAAAAFRYAVAPRLRPAFVRLGDELRGWVAPAERPKVALARVPTRTTPRR